MAREQTNLNASVEHHQEFNHSWDGGWYIFEGGQVLGPMNAAEAFLDESKISNQKSTRLISRKGFSQWYPVQDFASIHALAGKYMDYMNHESGKIALHGAENYRKHEPKATEIGLRPSEQSSVSNRIQDVQRELFSKMNQADDRVHFEPQQTITQQTTSTAQSKVAPIELKNHKIGRKERRRLKLEERRIRGANEVDASALKKSAKKQRLMPQISYEQQYLQVSSRLRLGRMKTPIVRAFLYVPLTLGIYWWAWLTQVSEEVSWHLNGSSKMNLILPMWFCMIPGLHVIMAYLVARMVRQMEVQNGYSTVNLWAATLASLFPPFFIIMIQSSLNRHWRLHVYHSAHVSC